MHRRISNRRGRPGMALVYAMIVMTLAIGLTALVVDLGRAVLAQTQLQAVADGAALYGAMGLFDGTSSAKALSSGSYNKIDGASFAIQSSDIQTGNFFGGVFTAGGSPTNAIRVSAHYTQARGLGLTPYFGSIIGFGKLDLNATATATSAPLFNFGIVGINFVNITGGANAGYNSTVSTSGYISNPTHPGTVESDGNITLSGGATIDGDALAGVGMTVSESGSTTTVTGRTSNLTAPLSFPNAVAGSAATTNNNTSVSSSYLNTFTRDLSVSGGKTITLPGGVYYFNNITLSGNASMQFSGPAIVYATGSVNLTGGTVVTSGNIPANLQIQVIGTGTVSMSGGSTFYADVYCPQSAYTLAGASTLAGRVIALSITQSGGSNIDYDQSLNVLPVGNPELVQ